MAKRLIARLFGVFGRKDSPVESIGLVTLFETLATLGVSKFEDQEKRYSAPPTRGVSKRDGRYRENVCGQPIYDPLARGASNISFIQELK